MTLSARAVRTTCTFCRYGCELEVLTDGPRVLGVEYPDDSKVNGGRLCPRGSASGLLLDHPMRLCYPLKDGKERTWPEFFAEAGAAVRDCPSNELAITYDRGLTMEEMEHVAGMALALGTENLATSYLESDLHAWSRLESKAKSARTDPLGISPGDITRADSILLIGDVFGVMPVIARPVLYAKYAERERRLFVLDSVRTRSAGFANRMLLVRPGTEPLVLLALAAMFDPRLSGFDPPAVAARCGIEPEALSELAAALAKPRRTVVLAALQSGRLADPGLLSAALQMLVTRVKGNIKLAMIGEALPILGPRQFGTVLDEVEQGRIRVLVNFGDAFPFDYPSILGRLSRLTLLVTTATMRPASSLPGWVLPVPMDLEKTGTVQTLWGPAQLNLTAEPASGTRTVPQIIAGLIGGEAVRQEMPERPVIVAGRAVTDRGRDLLSGSGNDAPKPEDELFTILAERPAYGYRGLFAGSDRCIGLNPEDAARLGLSDEDAVQVETVNGRKGNFIPRLSAEVSPGHALVDTNYPLARSLFDIKFDPATDLPVVPPARARLWRSA